ncbi:MAG TPA: histidine kinase [Thermoanaerobaculia bacterium]|nr:histidine kinase [Thermoanaerobaculia bacterium]
MAGAGPALDRGRMALYGAGGLAATALGASAFLLTPSAGTGLAIAAALPPSIVLGFLGLAARYPCRAMPLRRGSGARIVLTHAASAAAASGVWIVVWQWWLGVLGATAIAPDFPLLFGLGALLYLMAVAMHYLMLEVESAREAEEAALRYQVLAREAELKALKAQVDPHFLFNSLNAVASLCGSRPQDAREMAQLLAGFFRQTLRLGALDRITLREEVELASRYLAIEKIRFGERLSVRVAVDGEAAKAVVPPLILQPLVENAVRHGIASLVDGGTVALTVSSRDGRVRVLIENPADPDRPQGAGEGVGLNNVRERLSAFFAGRGELRAGEREGRYQVEIEVPR